MENLCSEGTISELYFHALIDMTKRVIENLSRKYVQVQKGVSDVMGGKVLDYEAKDILKRGIAEGQIEKLVSQIHKKLDKGQNITEIADALEESVEIIESLIQKYRLV